MFKKNISKDVNEWGKGSSSPDRNFKNISNSPLNVHCKNLESENKKDSAWYGCSMAGGGCDSWFGEDYAPSNFCHVRAIGDEKLIVFVKGRKPRCLTEGNWDTFEQNWILLEKLEILECWKEKKHTKPPSRKRRRKIKKRKKANTRRKNRWRCGMLLSGP